MEHAHLGHALRLIAPAQGEPARVRLWRRTGGLVVRALGLPRDSGRMLRAGTMSAAWLREHEAQAEKSGTAG